MHKTTQYSFFDQICLKIDHILRTFTEAQAPSAPYPAADVADMVLNDKARKHSAGLMRVNHAGEVCAQALYQGQALVTRNQQLRESLKRAALEEGNHLNWCSQRLAELQSHPSYLNPLWYAGSFCIGATAGMVGDRFSLGFIAETERQVIKHLEKHMTLLPQQDIRSTKILMQMQEEEAQHRDDALLAGGVELPSLIKRAMGVVSRVMVKTAYWL